MSRLVDDKSIERVVEALAAYRKNAGFNPEEIEIAVTNLEHTLIANAAWELVLEGAIDIDVQNGEVLFSRRG